jgi:hypothetical protein
VNVAIGVGSAGGAAPRGGGSGRATGRLAGRTAATGSPPACESPASPPAESPAPAAERPLSVEPASPARAALAAGLAAFTAAFEADLVPAALVARVATPAIAGTFLADVFAEAFAAVSTALRLPRAAAEPVPCGRDDCGSPRPPVGDAEASRSRRLATLGLRARPDFFFFDAAIPRNWDPPYCRLCTPVNRNGLNSRILPPTIRVVKVLSRPLPEPHSVSDLAEPA